MSLKSLDNLNPSSIPVGLVGEIELPKPRTNASKAELRARDIDLAMRYKARELITEAIAEAKKQKGDDREYDFDSLMTFAAEAGMSRELLSRYLKGNIEPGIRKILAIILLLPLASRQAIMSLLREELNLPAEAMPTALWELTPGLWLDLSKVPLDDLRNLLVDVSRAIAHPKDLIESEVGGIKLNLSSYDFVKKQNMMIQLANLLGKPLD